MKIPRRTIGMVVAVLLLTGSASAQEAREERVSFQKGASTATLQGSITGYEHVDYLLGARGGQTMAVSLETGNLSNYFNVLPPGSETALFVGSMGGNEWEGMLPDDGDYRIRVYLMRNAARRDESAKYSLNVSITGDPPTGAPASDAKKPGTPYHATGQLPCSIGTDPRGSSWCEFGVIRGTPGTAELHIQSPAGERRVIRFSDGEVTTPDSGVQLSVEKPADEWEIAVDDSEIYVIPEAVVYGG